MSPVTPQQVEQRLYQLSKEVDDAQTALAEAETTYTDVKARYEISLARERLRIRRDPVKFTVQDVTDMALLACEVLHLELAAAEAVVKAARGNANRVRTQVDIARSIGTSVRSSWDVS